MMGWTKMKGVVVVLAIDNIKHALNELVTCKCHLLSRTREGEITRALENPKISRDEQQW
jgi:hypothetical protein